MARGVVRRHSAVAPRMVIGLSVAILFAFGAVAARAEPAVIPRVTAPGAEGRFGEFIAEASQRFGIPAAWIRAVMRAESFGDVRATSPKGAIGLMQIMPETWAALRQRYHLGADPYDAHDNIIAGAGYLRELHDRYGVPGFLAAYNAGPGRWEDHLSSGRTLPLETRAYLARLAPVVADGAVDDTVLLASVVKSWTEASLFPPSTDHKSTTTNPPRSIRQGHRQTTVALRIGQGLRRNRAGCSSPSPVGIGPNEVDRRLAHPGGLWRRFESG